MAVRYTKRPQSQKPAPATAGVDLFAHAVTLHGAGRPAQALEIYERLMRDSQEEARIPELAGIACMQLQRHAEAVGHFKRAHRINPNNPQLNLNLGITLQQLGEVNAALGALKSAVSLQADYPEAWVQLGLLQEQEGRYRESAHAFIQAAGQAQPTQQVALAGLKRLASQPEGQQALQSVLTGAGASLDPSLAPLLIQSRSPSMAGLDGLSQQELLERAEAAQLRSDLQDAIRHLELFIQRDPANAAAWNNLGLLQRRAGNLSSAQLAFQRATQLDAAWAPAWNNLGICHLDAGALVNAEAAFHRALVADPSLGNVHANLGMLQRTRQNAPAALKHYRRAIELTPDLYEAHLNLGNLHQEFGNDAGAGVAFREAARIRPDDPEAAYGVGTTADDSNEALRALDRALTLRPGYAQAEIARAFVQLKACEWSGLDARLNRIEQWVRDPSAPALAPFWMLSLSSSRAVQQLCARKWTREKVLPRIPARSGTARVEVPKSASVARVGILSGDLRDHAVGQLLCDVLPRIDGKRCELFAYDVGPDDGSLARATLRGAFHTVREVATFSTGDLAARMQADDLDVLVDLSGYSQHSRSQVLGLRPAPVQVSYLGFPGSMGWDAVDYLMADDFLVPEPHTEDYDERILRLPVCYQPARRFVLDAAARPTRRDLGLPESGLVLASFGNPYKLRPQMFDCWLRLLRAEPRSVLWLARFNTAMQANLCSYAHARGINPSRLVFAPMTDLDTHLARLPLADLCLDTAPYGSGITATQALYAGVPLLTLAGATYVGRMAGSLLHALALPELVAEDAVDYENRALRLTGDDAWRLGLREQLAAARESGAAFNVDRSARDLEHAFLRLVEGGRGPINP